MGSCHSSCPSAGVELDFALTRNKSFKTVHARLRLVKDVNEVLPISMLTPLELAIKKKNYPIMTLLLERGANLEQRSNAEWTPLLRACQQGCLEPVTLLIERGADITARTPNGSTCLSLAAKEGHFPVISYLLEQYFCPINEVEANGYTALHYVSLLNDSRTMQVVIRRGAAVNAENQDGETPVFLATKSSCKNCLKVLLEAGADPNIGAKDGDFAIHEAVNRRCTESVTMLLKHGADRTKTGKDGLTPIQRAQSLTPLNPTIVDSLLNDYLVEWTGEEAHLDRKLGEEAMNKLGHEVKECICCPITFEVMRDPVIAADGHTYERSAIGQWLRQRRESPVTRQPMLSSTLTPNLAVRHLINQYTRMSESH